MSTTDDRDRRPEATLDGGEPTRVTPVDAILTPPDARTDADDGTTTGPSLTLEQLADGRYVLGRRLGAGGMGIVRAARDEVLAREVAVKLLADNLAADADARERFLREARAAARIHDPHVVAVHDVGDDAGRPFLVMELVDGPSLADRLSDEGALDPHEVVEVAAQALAGIAKAHDAGLLHRDIKPGNLLCHPDGTVKVTDFGVAEAADAPGITRTGFVIGTRSYLAPERRRGRPADPRTDLYALGATLVELLTGAPPGEADRVELPDDTPGGLARLVGTLLEPDPDDRPATAEDALEVLLGGGSSTAEEAVRAIDDHAEVATTARVAAESTAELPAEPDEHDRDPGSAPAVAPDRAAPTEPPDDATSPVMPWRTVAIAAAALLGVVLLVQLLGGAPDGDASPEVTGPGVEVVDGDPAATARNLADWLRDRAADDAG